MPRGQTRSPRIAWRRLNGILLLDKPSGASSNAILQRVRRLFRAEKGGHTGSLDPLATGLLPICFGEATKIAGLLLGFAIGFGCRAFGVPVPAPPVLVGALLVVAMTSGYMLADRALVRREARHRRDCGGPTGHGVRSDRP